MVEILKVVDDRQQQQRRLARQRLPRAEGEGQGRRRLRDRVLPAQRGPEVHDPVHQAQGVGGAGLPAHRQEPVVLRPQRGQVGAAHRARAHRRHQLAALGLRRVAAGRGVRPDRRGRGEAGRLHRAQAAAQGQAGPRPGVPGDPDVDRQGHQERPQAPGVRAVGAAAAHVVLPEVEEGLQRVEEGATSGTRRRSASSTRSRRRTRRWC